MNTVEARIKIESQGTDEKIAPKKIKRSYYLTEDCINKLQRMKLDDFPIGTSLESIVEKAIIYFYENNHK